MSTAMEEKPFQMGQVGRHTLIYGAGVLLGKAVAFVMLPVYTRFLTPADYGVMELIGMTLDIIAIVAGAKLAVGIFRYYHKAEREDEKRLVVSSALAALGLSYGVVGAMAFLAAPGLSMLVFGSTEHTLLIRVAAVNLALQSMLVVPLAYARVRNRSKLFVLAEGAKLLVGLTLNIVLLVYLGWGVLGVFTASLTATVLVGVVLTAWVVREVGLGFSRDATRDLLRYGVPLIGTQLAAFALTFGDRYFLKASADTSTVGLYALAYQFGFLLAFVGYIPFEMVWEPIRFQVAKRSDRDAVFSRAFRYMTILLLTVAVVISLFVGDVLRVMAAPAFLPAATLVPVILIAYVLQGWTQMHDVGILVREKTGYLTVANWIAAAVAIAGYALLIPRWLGMGAAVATVIAFAARFLVVSMVAQRLWPVRWDWAPVLRVAAAAAGTGLLAALLPPLPWLASVGLHCALFVAYAALVWHLDVLSPSDRAALRRLVLSPGAALSGLRAAA